MQSSWRKDFDVAVEEAEEIAAVRSGRDPVTNHQPLDFRLEAPMYDVEYGVETGALPGPRTILRGQHMQCEVSSCSFRTGRAAVMRMLYPQVH